MDFTFLTEYFVAVVLVACLVVGYIINNATFLQWIKNDNIPVVLAVFGCILNLVVTGLSVEYAVYGAVMGLASTGLHQGFKTFIEGRNTEVDENAG